MNNQILNVSNASFLLKNVKDCFNKRIYRTNDDIHVY